MMCKFLFKNKQVGNVWPLVYGFFYQISPETDLEYVGLVDTRQFSVLSR